MGQLNIRDVDDVLLHKLKLCAVEEKRTMKSVVEELLGSLRTELPSSRLLGGSGKAAKVAAAVSGVKLAKELIDYAPERVIVPEVE
jgi:plasmid stability protein